MSTNPNQGSGQSGNYGGYGGYGGYQPNNPADDPYSAGSQTGTGSTTGGTPQSDPNYAYGQQRQQQQQYTTGQQSQQQQYSYGQQQQQSNSYVPPLSATRGGTYSSTDQQSRRAALISYLGLCFTGIVMFFVGRKNSFVRFSAAQSVVLFTPIFIVYLLVRLLGTISLVGVLLGPILGCISGILLIGGGILWVFLMLQAYRGVAVRLPFVAPYADALVARFSKKGTV